MKARMSMVVVTVALLCMGLPAAGQDVWWLGQQRLIQTNLREIDATMDIDKYVQEVQDFGASVVLFNVGGIVANYPTELEYHWRNTFMKGDFAETVLKRLHENGLVQCHQGHAELVIGAIDGVLGVDRMLTVEAPPLVEVTHRKSKKGDFEWVALYNHSGQLNNALHGPIAVSDIRISIKGDRPVKAVRLLSSGKKLRISKAAGRASVTVPRLGHYEIALFEYD